MSDVNINLGTDEGQINNSSVRIDKVSAGAGGVQLTQQLVDQLWNELREIKDRIRRLEEVKDRVQRLEVFLGGELGQQGFTQQLRDMQADVRKFEKRIDVVDLVNSRLDRHELTIDQFVPVWRESALLMPTMREIVMSYRGKTATPAWVPYVAGAGVAFVVVVMFVLVIFGRGLIR